MTRVLYVHHADTIGGAAMSLLYTIQGLNRRRYEAVIALTQPSEPLSRLYADAGIETVPAPGITTYNHTTGGWFGYHNPLDYLNRVRQAMGIRAGAAATSRLLRQVRPDLVHLNSVVLLPSAIALAKSGAPFVWHVRESPVRGLLRRRLLWIRRRLLHLPTVLIFISEHDRREWTGADHMGEVINCFVDFRRFERRLDGAAARRKLGLESEDQVVLYVGGLSRIKGVLPLMRALGLLRSRFPRLRCLMPASQMPKASGLLLSLARTVLPIIGSGTYAQKVEAEIERRGLGECLLRMPPDPYLAAYFAAADVVVFPSTVPHYARPVVEAGAMAKPVVASRIGGVAELVDDGITGLLVEPNDAEALAEGIAVVLGDPPRARQMGDAGYLMARARFDMVTNARRIEQLYERVLHDQAPGSGRAGAGGIR